MKSAMLGLLAETPVHPGAGSGMGVVDLPVAREAATDYPVLVGSSLKGALRDKMETGDKRGSMAVFGVPERAGDLLVADARLLLLPVRSLTGAYRWATCPHLIERYRRDLGRSGLLPCPEAVEVPHGSVLASGSGSLILEERQFSICGAPARDMVDAIAPLILHHETGQRLTDQIAILHDHDFSWFARYGLAVQARNVLADDGTKRSKNLWYEETLPSDTVLYALVMGRDEAALGALDALFGTGAPYLQAGGNETVGQGWFAVTVRKSDAEGPQ